MRQGGDPTSEITLRLGELTLTVPPGQELRIASAPGAYSVSVASPCIAPSGAAASAYSAPHAFAPQSPPGGSLDWETRQPLPLPADTAPQPPSPGSRGWEDRAAPPLTSSSAPQSPGFGSLDWEDHLLSCTAPRELHLVDLGPHARFVGRLSRGASDWTCEARIARAVRAGVAARHRRGRAPPVSSPQIPFPNRYYVGLCCDLYPQGFWCTSYALYAAAIRGRDGARFAAGSASHAFATLAEASAYLAGAQAPWPAKLQ